MDDFLYILIGIVWVVYSLYNNKQKQDRKKAAREMRETSQPATPAKPKRSLLEEILMGEVLQVPEPQEVTIEPPVREFTRKVNSEEIDVRKTEAQSLELIAEEVPADYFEQEYTYRKEEKDDVSLIRDNLKSGTETTDQETEIHENFDLKTAVIYAEILNPRYI